ncbi:MULTISPECIES: FadR/GntR family transcriptional regulator [unclassified Mycobacterium]|uniref:FadR/GntR family transcriptional regulator n=1 Tax=unclassified Mycobacterium TaxID=2642494 RepID=UPI001CD99C65|nr:MULTISPECIES: GntR family transcriptional regulator [unclassified Mycobacterium]
MAGRAVGRDVAKRTTLTGSAVQAQTAGKPKQIADELRALIITGGLDEGDLLGTEADLLERFGVSRPSLREALRILEAEGLISVVRGALGGVVVHRPDQRTTARAAALVLQSRSVSLADVFDASAVIEPAAARMVATSRGHQRAANQLRQVIVDQKRTVNDPLASTNAMIRFHGDIVRLAGNQTLILVTEMLNEVIARAIADVLTRTRHEPVTARRRTIRAHELLVEFIAAGDGDGAQAHWNTHMARLRGSLLGEHAATVVDLNHHR